LTPFSIPYPQLRVSRLRGNGGEAGRERRREEVERWRGDDGERWRGKLGVLSTLGIKAKGNDVNVIRGIC